jgi:hypothetical protein
VFLVASVDQFLGELIIAVAGIDAERNGILLGEMSGEFRLSDGVEVVLTGTVGAKGLVEDVEDRLLTRIERFVAVLSCKPAVSRPLRMSLMGGGPAKRTYTSVPPRKSIP